MTHNTALDIQVLANDHHGIYCPQVALEGIPSEQMRGISADNLATILEGPDAEYYWDAWDEILANGAQVADNDGNWYTLDQVDGTVYAIPVGMEWDEAIDGYAWPNSEEDEDED